MLMQRIINFNPYTSLLITKNLTILLHQQLILIPITILLFSSTSNIFFAHAQSNCLAPRPRNTGGYITCGSTVTGTTIEKSQVHVAECGTNTGRAGAEWYFFKTATAENVNQKVTISTCHKQTDFDTKVGVFTCEGECVGGNDDAVKELTPCQYGDSMSTFSFVADGGGDTIYNFLVHGYRNNTGNYALSVECIDIPPPIQNTREQDNGVLSNNEAASQEANNGPTEEPNGYNTLSTSSRQSSSSTTSNIMPYPATSSATILNRTVLSRVATFISLCASVLGFLT